MRITWNELTIDPDGLDFDSLLEEWRWLVPETMSPVVVSALGDLFLRDQDDSIHWLDTGTGQLSRVADSPNEFKQLMQQPDHANEWFIPQLIGDLIESGAVLGTGECYSCDVPPGLGGEFTVDNVKPTDIRVHFSMFGQIFFQTKDLPPGTPIDNIRFGDA
ncbi:MAG: T6SS immunity protein Tdi1 domain-containing protein [Planctomycetota bacterium]